MVRQAPPLPCPLHPDRLLLDQPGRAVVRSADGSVRFNGGSDDQGDASDDGDRRGGRAGRAGGSGTVDHDFPQAPARQLHRAILAVFGSWNAERAVLYRRREHIPDDLETAVTVQRMVFGNLGHDSGSGVAFTRDPATGRPALYGDYLPSGAPHGPGLGKTPWSRRTERLTAAQRVLLVRGCRPDWVYRRNEGARARRTR
ncbi:PEP/pyruvate-binding domain-containing protein [Streptomyces sp. NPDC093260]|uniref:PEP/pyruvate-binding domain-containing protein n=1 Tax=Streptomyces sp. NPDC093260 TaxID=3155073 RepID=UPI003433823D